VDPVRVKLYRLTSMTRRGYLIQLAVSVVIVIGFLAFWWLRWPELRWDPATAHHPISRWVAIFFDNVPWVVGTIGVLLLLEATIVLRRFARKEAERASQTTPK
jgi:hypothetical protein